MQRMIFECDPCEEAMHVCATPIVIYMVVGSATGETIDLEAHKDKIPPFLQALLAQPVSRVEWCLECFKKHVKVSTKETDRLLAKL